MPPMSKPSSVGLRFLGMLKNAVESEDGLGLAALCQHILVQPPCGGPLVSYTVYVSPDVRGTFLVTCKELPDLRIDCENEEEALSLAEAAIREALGARPSSPDSP